MGARSPSRLLPSREMRLLELSRVAKITQLFRALASRSRAEHLPAVGAFAFWFSQIVIGEIRD